jgi:hypothetical protein
MDEPSSQQRGYRVSLPFKTIAGVWYEAEPSTRDMSVRELRRTGPHYINHRFKFRGGVPAIVAKYRYLTADNEIVQCLKQLRRFAWISR